jgi:pimeloyl-ACP methyl ester carboxylesterase
MILHYYCIYSNYIFIYNQFINTFIGKSWGGGMALDMVMLKPDRVNKLALIAPSGAPRLIPSFLGKSGNKKFLYGNFLRIKFISFSFCVFLELNSIPFFLGWATDDPISSPWSVPQWKQTAQESNRIFTTKEIPTGGHVVNAEYADAVLEFLKK